MSEDTLARLHRLTPRAWVTPSIVALNLAVWAASIVAGAGILNPGGAELLALGGNRLAETRAEPWRLLSATTLHAGLLHLALNMWVLWDIGRAAERFFGNLQFLLVYLLAGLGGSLTSLFFAGKTAVSVGASGAIFGVVGALLAAIWIRPDSLPGPLIRSLKKSLMVFVGVSLILGLTAGGVDNAAHLGGLVTGLMMAMVIDNRLGWTRSPGRAALRMTLALALAALAAAVAWRALA